MKNSDFLPLIHLMKTKSEAAFKYAEISGMLKVGKKNEYGSFDGIFQDSNGQEIAIMVHSAVQVKVGNWYRFHDVTVLKTPDSVCVLVVKKCLKSKKSRLSLNDLVSHINHHETSVCANDSPYGSLDDFQDFY